MYIHFSDAILLQIVLTNILKVEETKAWAEEISNPTGTSTSPEERIDSTENIPPLLTM